MSAVAHPPRGLTWDQFLALPHETRNCALIDGEVVVDAPNAQHELVVWNLGSIFRKWIRSGSSRGEVSTQQPVKINDRRGYQPDFAWYPQELCAPPDQSRSFSGPPGLIVEVLSPTTRTFDLMRKRSDYENIGIGEVWFVDQIPGQYAIRACQRPRPGKPFADIEVGPDDQLTSPLLEDFTLRVSALFEI